MGGRTGSLFVKAGGGRPRADDMAAVLRSPLLLSAGGPLSSAGTAEPRQRGSVYSAVAAPRHRSAHVSPRLGASAVTGTAGVGRSGSKGFWPKLTFGDSQIINFSLMAILL